MKRAKCSVCGSTFRPDKPTSKYFYPDFTVPSKNLVIQADGDYWHSLEHHPEQCEEDLRQDVFLTHEGWEVLRLPGSLLRENVESCVRTVEGMAI